MGFFILCIIVGLCFVIPGGIVTVGFFILVFAPLWLALHLILSAISHIFNGGGK